MKRSISPRVYFVVATLLTLFLLVGSVILQQIAFKADQEAATLVLSPTNFRSTEGQMVDLEIQTNSADTVFATGFQANLRFDGSRLEFVEAVPATGWSTLSVSSAVGRVQWLSTPVPTETTITELKGPAVLGRLRFRSIKSGVATVNFEQSDTILAAVDPVQGNFVYNAATSVQSSAGTVASLGEAEQKFPEVKIETLTAPESSAEPLFGSQRITSTYAVPTSRDALIFIALGYPGRAHVEFGLTPQFGNSVESLGESTHHVLQLSSLAPATQYYYRVIGEQTGEQSRVVGTTRSLTLPPSSDGGLVSAKTSEVVMFPNKTAREANLYIFPRDEQGAIISTEAITVPAVDNVQIGQPKKQAGYLTFELTGQSSGKEVVTLRPVADDGTLLNSASLIIDPEFKPGAQNRTVKELVLDWNQKTTAVLFGAVILVFLLSLGFVRLVRSR